MEHHSLDPRWEVSIYSICHRVIRSRTGLGTRIFDLVVRDEKAVIRSAFVVDSTNGEDHSRVLLFNGYYFADGKPVELPGYFIRYRMKKASKDELESCWVQINDAILTTRRVKSQPQYRQNAGKRWWKKHQRYASGMRRAILGI